MRKQFSTMYCMKIQFLFFDFDLGGNLESFSRLEVTVHRHVANLWQMQLKAFVRSVRIAPKTLLLSTFFLFNYLSIIKRREYCAPIVFRNHLEILKIYYQNDLAVAFTLAFQNLWRQQVKYLWVYIYPYDF